MNLVSRIPDDHLYFITLISTHNEKSAFYFPLRANDKRDICANFISA